MPRVLVVCPTRELAAPIGDSFQTHGRYLRFRHGVIFGGVGQNPQVRALTRGVHVLIATSGRLLDRMNQGHVRLDGLDTFILDEADRILELARQLLRNPVPVSVAPPATAVELIEQSVLFVEQTEKRALLEELLQSSAASRVLVFTRTKRRADQVARHLSRSGIRADAIHSNKSQNARQRLLHGFHTDPGGRGPFPAGLVTAPMPPTHLGPRCRNRRGADMASMRNPDGEDTGRRRPGFERRQGPGSRRTGAEDERPARGARDKSVRIGATRVGKGVFARRRYPAETVIGEIEGQIIDDPHYGSDYCMNVGDGRALEPAAPFRYVNHSCEPNCEFDFFDLPDAGPTETQRRVFLFALREIKPGEELTIDYNWAAGSAIPCRCQSPSCRGWIVDPGQLDALMARLAAQNAS